MKNSRKAGDKKNILGLVKDDFLAPLPLPTGERPNNAMGMVWRLNDTYMDVSDCTPGSAVSGMHCVLIISALILLWVSSGSGLEYFMDWMGFFIIFSSVLFPSIVIMALVFIKPREPMRFNRQRREVCVPNSKGHDYWFVPWETVKASVEQYNAVSQGGVMTTSSLTIGFPNPNFTGDIKLNKQGYNDNPDAERHLWFPTGNAGMWELIRVYMEEGPSDITVHLSGFDIKNKSILSIYIEDVQYGIKERGLAKGLLWEGFCGLFVFNLPLLHYINRKHLSPPPDLIGDEVEAWSQPMPPEQWAKRSPELEQALRELEVKQEQKSVA